MYRMIEYKIKQPDIFIKCLKSLAVAGDYLLFRFGKGLITFGKDPSGIYLYYAEFGSSLIEIIQDGKIDVFVNLQDVVKILNRFSLIEEFTILYDDLNERIVFRVKVNNRRKTFKLALMDEDVVELKEALDNIQLNTMFKINGADFYDSIQDVEIYSEACTIKTIDNTVIVDGSGVSGETTSEIELDVQPTDNSQCGYSIKYLKMILATMTGSDIIVGFDKDKPIMIHNKISNDSYIKWYLAPRVEQEDDDWGE